MFLQPLIFNIGLTYVVLEYNIHPQTLPIEAKTRFRILQDSDEYSSDQKSLLDILVVLDDRTSIEQGSVHSANRDKRVLHQDNTRSYIDHNMFNDTDKECDNVEQYTHVDQNISDIICLHKIVSRSGKPVKSQLKIAAWRKHLNTYWDQQIVDLLEFGFLLDFDRNVQLQSTEFYHKSAIQRSS